MIYRRQTMGKNHTPELDKKYKHIIKSRILRKEIRINKLKEQRKRIIHSLEQNPAQKIIYSAMIKKIDKEIENV